MLRLVALVRTDVSEEPSSSFIRVTRIGQLGTTLAVTSNWRTLVFLRSVRWLLVAACVVSSSPILVTLMKEALSSSKTSVLTRATRRNIPEDAILHAPACLERIGLSWWYLFRDKKLTCRTFVSKSCKLQSKYFGFISKILVSVKRRKYLKNAVFLDVTPCDCCKDRRFGRTYRLIVWQYFFATYFCC
jgi:hypothetical protein